MRLAQYENGSRTPKADVTFALAQVLDVSPKALDVPDIDSYTGLMHTLFTLEDRYGLHIDEADGEVCLKVDVRKKKGCRTASRNAVYLATGCRFAQSRQDHTGRIRPLALPLS